MIDYVGCYSRDINALFSQQNVLTDSRRVPNRFFFFNFARDE